MTRAYVRICIVPGFERKIRDALREQWGPEWFRQKDFAKKVEAGAAQGYRLPLAEFLGIWGVSALDPSVLTSDLAQTEG